MRGSPGFRAPELLVMECDAQGNPQPGEFSRKSDIWSVGCILYEIVTGYQIFLNDLQTRFFAMGLAEGGLLDALDIDDNSHPFFLRETFCPIEQRKTCFLSQIRSIISACLSSKPLDRPTAMQLKVRFEEMKEYLIEDMSEEELKAWKSI
jgi:serine/threonine protein kinase